MIFINYRREDSAATAGRLHDRLAQVFGRKRIFMDVDQIPAGIDFVAHLNSQVAACNVLLVVIGRQWLNVKNEAGERRLHQPDDFVAIEIAAALARDIRVIPVLVDGATIPRVSELPDSLKPLVRRQSIDVRQAHFGRDAEALIERLREVLGDKAGLGRWRALALAGAAAIAALLLIVVGGYVFVGHVVEQGVQRAELKLEEERKAAEAEANRKVMENQAQQDRQAKAAQEAEQKRKADDAEKARQAAESKAAQATAAQAAAADGRQAASANTPATVASNLFDRKTNTDITGGASAYPGSPGNYSSADGCVQSCANDKTCMAYTYNKRTQVCYIYYSLTNYYLVANGDYDTGIRQPVAKASARQEAPVPATVATGIRQPGADGLRRVALVIGNSAYQNAPVLPNPERDARGIADMFQKAGYEVVTTAFNVGNLDFKSTIRKFEDTVTDADIAVIYYAGYGLEIHGTNYLIPIDAKLSSDSDVDNEAMTLEQLVESVHGAKRLRIIILDACRDNPFARTMKAHGVLATAFALGAVEPNSNDTLIAYATKPGTTAQDGGGDHSPFTAALIDNLFVPGLDIRLAFGRVRDEVLKKTGYTQEPFVYGSLGGGNITLVPVVDSAAEKADFALVEKIGTKGAWETFLNQHPTGFYADLARQQLNMLKQPF